MDEKHGLHPKPHSAAYKEMIKRRKICVIPLDLILKIMNGLKDAEMVTLPILGGLPEGSLVIDVFPDQSRRCFLASVVHPSFPEVPFGMLPEEIGGIFLTQRIFKVDHTHEIPTLIAELKQGECRDYGALDIMGDKDHESG